MKNSPLEYIRSSIEKFQIPGSDSLTECLLRLPNRNEVAWDSGIFISEGQTNKVYVDVFQFWVRAFFCFVEDTQAGSLFKDVLPFLEYREMTVEAFKHNYFAVIHQREFDSTFVERQKYSNTYVELEKRTFSEPFIVLDRQNIKSAAALSDGEFIAYFTTTRSGKLVRIVR